MGLGAMLASLATEVHAVPQDRAVTELDHDATSTRTAAMELAEGLGATPEEVSAHLARLPERYAATVSPRAVVRHALMCRRKLDPLEVRSRVTPGRDDPEGHEGIDELDVVALDHPGWFATVAGVAALNGGSVVGADAFARDDGVAVDTFSISLPPSAAGSWWARVEGDLSEAAAGRLAVRARVLRQRRGEQQAEGRPSPVPVEITTDLDSSGTATLVEVRTRDRLGALYMIATMFAELHLDLVVARVQTLGDEVVDVFTVRNARGEPVDADHLVELELSIRTALQMS